LAVEGLGFDVVEVVEGAARILVPRVDRPTSRAPVFYNPVMSLNRDVAVAALQAYRRMLGRDVVVCEPMCGTGVRGVRFLLEVEGVEHVLMNDLNPRAVRLARVNLELNHVSDRADVENMDANTLLMLHSAPGRRFDYVDLDPFGCPTPYLDSCVRALKKGGMLAVTATDVAVLCGAHPEPCLRKYGAVTARTEYCHELAVRILLGAVASAAARHERAFRVLFSHSTDHYVRVYGILRGGARGADEAVSNLGYVLHCPECLWRTAVRGVAVPLPAECPECGGRLLMAGPLWVGRLWDEGFCRAMLSEAENMGLPSRTVRLIRTVLEECGGPPTYYNVDRVCQLAGTSSLPIDLVVQRLRSMGYWASRTHFHPKGVRTDAPLRALKEAVVG